MNDYFSIVNHAVLFDRMQNQVARLSQSGPGPNFLRCPGTGPDQQAKCRDRPLEDRTDSLGPISDPANYGNPNPH